jgi:hypothetical protein
VDVFVAAAAGYQGLAPSHGHEVHPGGFLPSAGLAEIGELANVVDLEARHGLADFAAPGEEPVDQLVAPGTGHDRPLVGEDGRADSLERDAAEAGDQRSPSIAQQAHPRPWACRPHPSEIGAYWGVMSRISAGSRRYLPGSPFNVLEEPAPPAVFYAPQDRVTHDKYGLGTILTVEEGIAVTVDFGSHTQRISIPCPKMIKL